MYFHESSFPASRSRSISCIASASLLLLASEALAQEAPKIEEILITGTREARVSQGATGLRLSLFETPQSVSIIDERFMDSFNLDSVNSVLNLATGVNVEAVETDRTYYNSRGYDIKSMQVDATGLPFNWNVVGTLDTAIYEKVEVIRGANGLLTGTGNPSGTINYVRKRPRNDFAANVRLSSGSYDAKRAELDVSTPLTGDSRWAARLVAAAQDGDSHKSHLDLYEHNRSLIYGVVDGQLGDSTTLTAGYTKQESESEGVLWGALPLLYADGSPTDYPVNTSTSMDWTFWKPETETAFVEVVQQLDSGWEIKSVLTQSRYEEPSELFYTYGSPNQDGEGLFGWPGKYLASSERAMLDVWANGAAALFGRSHEFMLGLNVAKSEDGYKQYTAEAGPAWGALPAFPGWSGSEIARPDFGPGVVEADIDGDIHRLYGAGNFSLTDSLNMIIGFNTVEVKSRGYSFGEPADQDERETSPYVGLVYQITDQLNAYASFSDIYQPQSEIAQDMRPLGSAVGNSYETGIKAELFNGRLLTTAAIFRAEQENYAEAAGMVNGVSVYRGVDFTSKGYELEAAGRLSDSWWLQLGFTDMELEDEQGNAARTFIPERSLKLGTRYEPALIPGLELGLAYRWQEAIYLDTGLGRIEQDSYGVISSYLSYAVNNNIAVRANVDNVADEKYLNSLYWEQAYYAAPRTASLSVELSF